MGNAVVYRPAYDAEVEYLESTGTQWIDTGIVLNSEMTIELSFMLTRLNDMNSLIFGAFTDNAESDRVQLFVNSLHKFSIGDGTESVSGLYIGDTSSTNTIYNISFTTLSQLNASYPMWLFARNNDVMNYLPYNGLRIYSCSIKETDSGLVLRDFIPVRIGSVGYLYDKVSKQLFANKGTGQFILGNDVVNATIPQQRCVLYFGSQRSVGFERIYEEYEWLKGDRAATLYLGNYNDKVEFDCRLNVPSVTYGFIYGYNGVLRTLKSDNYNEFRTEIAENRITSISPIPVSDLHVSLDFNNHNVYVNETKICYTDKHSQEDAYGNEQAYKQAYFFGSLIWESFNSDGLLGNVIADGKSFIPCKLTHGIPASMDANSIARPAGTCGMWDKVNDKFYGNVASSGTFTVSND